MPDTGVFEGDTVVQVVLRLHKHPRPKARCLRLSTHCVPFSAHLSHLTFTPAAGTRLRRMPGTGARRVSSHLAGLSCSWLVRWRSVLVRPSRPWRGPGETAVEQHRQGAEVGRTARRDPCGKFRCPPPRAHHEDQAQAQAQAKTCGIQPYESALPWTRRLSDLIRRRLLWLFAPPI